MFSSPFSKNTFAENNYPTKYPPRSKLIMSFWSPTVAALLAALAIVLILQVEGTEAKRGCANFGHSCYGGMGKRAGDITDEVAQEINQDEENPALVFTGPRSEYKPQHGPRYNSQQLFNLSPFLRQWLRSFRNLEDLPPSDNK